MTSSWLVDRQVETLQDPALERIQALLRELLSCRSTTVMDLSNGEGNGEEIIFDVDVGGERYLLVRMPSRIGGESKTLSPREMEIARMVAEGYANKTIASVLEISSWTVGTHLRRIFAKLGVRTRAAMVARLSEQGALQDAPLPTESGLANRRVAVR